MDLTELTKKIAVVIDPHLYLEGVTAREAYRKADAILAIPEIAEALASKSSVDEIHDRIARTRRSIGQGARRTEGRFKLPSP